MFSCSGLLWLLIVRSHFWPFADVQNGNQREVTLKCGSFLKPKETNEGGLYLVPAIERQSLCSFVAFR